MDLSAVTRLIGATALVDVDTCRLELEQLRACRGVLDAREVQVLGCLDDLTASHPTIHPDDEVAKASKSSLSRATKVRARKKVCEGVPELGDALAQGDTTGERIDVFARAAAGLSSDELASVATHGALLAHAAAESTDRQYRELVERLVGQARHDDGLDQLARQRAASRLRWSTGADGMWNFSGCLDPVRGAEVEGRIRRAVEALFHGAPPDDAPTDPFDRQQHLAVLALVSLVGGTAPSGAAPDVTVVIDARTLIEGRRHPESVVDAGLGRFGLPIETVRRWACLGTVTPVVVGADGVRLFLGRETRLANRDQRRALRVLYRTCALCEVPFEHTQMHHVSWFGRHGGTTDLHNLLPLCSRHHHLVHEGGWVLRLHPDRSVTVTLPDGRVHSHAPPRARAA